MIIFNTCFFVCIHSLSEIAKVRASLFQINGVRKEPLKLPEPDGTPVTLNEKVYVPVKEHPDVSTIYFYIYIGIRNYRGANVSEMRFFFVWLSVARRR